MYDALTPSIRAWSKRILQTIDACVRDHKQVDVDNVVSALSSVATWPGCPQSGMLFSAPITPAYRRIPLGVGTARNYEALLILWPPGHATPIHDHDGLWGMEFVLDGVLEVESFQLCPQPPVHLEHDHSLVVGVGDHIAFSQADYAHRCRNLSKTRQALSLHVYGGELNCYRSFTHDDGQWFSEFHRTTRDEATST